MTCLRPAARRTLPAVFRRRMLRKLEGMAQRAHARHMRDQLARRLPRFIEFPIDAKSVN